MPTTLESRFPMIVAELRLRVSAAVKASAEMIAEDAKMKVADPAPVGVGLRAAIHVEREDVAEYSVVAGNDDVFYGHMVEHGTSHSAPHPFLIPAKEENTAEAVGLVSAALKGL